jgi:hypothetical protein
MKKSLGLNRKFPLLVRPRSLDCNRAKLIRAKSINSGVRCAVFVDCSGRKAVIVGSNYCESKVDRDRLSKIINAESGFHLSGGKRKKLPRMVIHPE